MAWRMYLATLSFLTCPASDQLQEANIPVYLKKQNNGTHICMIFKPRILLAFAAGGQLRMLSQAKTVVILSAKRQCYIDF